MGGVRETERREKRVKSEVHCQIPSTKGGGGGGDDGGKNSRFLDWP